MRDAPHIRLIHEDDVAAVSDLYRRVYGEQFPFKEFYDTAWIKRGVFDDDIRWFVAEQGGVLVGSAAVMLNAGDMNDGVAEVGRLVVDPAARAHGLGARLIAAADESIEGLSDFAFAECRTAHPAAQRILTRRGYRVVGVEPLAFEVGGRESVVYVCKLRGNALPLRRNHPRVIPAAHALASLALRACDLDDDAVVDPAEPYPVARGDAYELVPLEDRQVYRLLRLSRASRLRPEIVGSDRLEYGYLKLKTHAARYLVCRRGGTVVGGLGYVWDDIDRKVRVFELVATDDLAKGTLVERALARIEAEHDPAYVAIDVSAHAPRMQRTLDLLGFAPVAYAPSMVYSLGERYDVVKWARLRVPPRLDHWQLDPVAQPAARLVERAVIARARGVEADAWVRRVGLFDGLSDVQVGRIAAVCHELEYGPGETVFRAGTPEQALFLVVEGRIDIVDEPGGRRLRSLEPGAMFGEMALVEALPRSAGAVCARAARLLRIEADDFDHVVHSDAGVGSAVYRNIARAISARLRAAPGTGDRGGR